MLDSEIQAVIRILKRIMKRDYLSMQGLARRLGFSVSHLSMIFSGRRRPGLRFIRAAMKRYPEVRQVLRAQWEEPERHGQGEAP